MPAPAVTSIVSIGSGTILMGRNYGYINDSAANVSGTVLVTLKTNPTNTAGAGGIKYIQYMPGVPKAAQSLKVVLNAPAGTNLGFNYAIVSGSDFYN